MSQAKISITADARSVEWLNELSARLSAFADLVEKPVDIVQLVRDLSHCRVAAFDLNFVRTTKTNDSRIVLKPRKALNRLMTTLRARDGDFEFVDDAPGLAG